MKIARIVVDRCELPLQPPFVASWDPVPRSALPATVVRVETDDGAIGVGGGDTLHGVESHLPLLIGTDPRRIEAQVRLLETIDLHAGRPWPLEVALWDLIGVASGEPLWRRFGGVSDRVAAYASLGARRDADALADAVLDVRDRGFPACKIRLAASRPNEAITAAQAVRAVVGPSFALMVDLNQAWHVPGDIGRPIDLATARRIADALGELDVTWLEEPLPVADHAGLATLRERCAVRIAGGELTRTFDELLDAVMTDRYDVHQPDVALSGMSRGRTIAELAQRRGRWYTPHTWTDGIGLAANLHVCAGVGGGPYLEYPYDPAGWTPDRRDFVLDTPIGVADGDLVAGDQPGLGISIDAAVIDATRVERIVATARGVERST